MIWKNKKNNSTLKQFLDQIQGLPKEDIISKIMACFAVTLGVIILSGFIKLSAANKDICDLYGAVGQSLTLINGGLAKTDGLRWTHNNTIIFYKQQNKLSVGKPGDISVTGSLFLNNLKFSSAGIYEANVLHPNSTWTNTWTGRLCMMDKVSKPQLSYVCDFKSSAVNLNCHVAKPQGLSFSWTLDEKILSSETKQTLSISLAHLKGDRSFTCSVANKVSNEMSDAVRPTCKSPSPSPPISLCFTRKTVVAVLAGGSSLILLLLIIIIILCCCHRCNKKKMRLRDKGEIRMLSLNKQEPDSICPEYETMHPTEDSSTPPSPKPSPRTSYQIVVQPEVQTENRPPKLSTAAEDQQPSPVPKPRTKGPQTPNVWIWVQLEVWPAEFSLKFANLVEVKTLFPKKQMFQELWHGFVFSLVAIQLKQNGENCTKKSLIFLWIINLHIVFFTSSIAFICTVYWQWSYLCQGLLGLIIMCCGPGREDLGQHHLYFPINFKCNFMCKVKVLFYKSLVVWSLLHIMIQKPC